MEQSLHKAIGAALKIEHIQLQILCANIRFRDRIDILRTLIDVSLFSKDEKFIAKKTLKKLGDYSVNRNMIAHTQFLPDPSNRGVQFLTIKAKGTFETKNKIWIPHTFEIANQLLNRRMLLLQDIEHCFNKTPLTDQSYAMALYAGIPLPMRPITSPALWNYQSRHNQAHPDNSPATPSEDLQKRDKPPET
jgi:hypothetical protein